MPPINPHDAYAGTYDTQAREYQCYIGDLLFGLCYEYVQPGQTALDVGIGTGLSSILFVQAGLQVFGTDFSPAMLNACRAKGIASGLVLQDLRAGALPFQAGAFDIVTCCGVFHFIPDITRVLGEARQLLRTPGIFAFTTRNPSPQTASSSMVAHEVKDGFDIYSHAAVYVESLLSQDGFRRLKVQECLVGDSVFSLWVAQRV